MNRKFSSEILKKLLDEEIETIDTLNQCLKYEYNCLASNKHDLLLESSSKKVSILKKLEQLQQKRSALLHLDPSTATQRDEVEAAIKSNNSPQTQILMQSWSKLLLQLSHCRRQNEINGQIINVSSHSVKTALDILKGTNTTESIQYGKDGKQHYKKQTVAFAKA